MYKVCMEASNVNIFKNLINLNPLFFAAKRKQNSVYQKTDRQKGLALILNFSKDRSGKECTDICILLKRNSIFLRDDK